MIADMHPRDLEDALAREHGIRTDIPETPLTQETAEQYLLPLRYVLDPTEIAVWIEAQENLPPAAET